MASGDRADNLTAANTHLLRALSALKVFNLAIFYLVLAILYYEIVLLPLIDVFVAEETGSLWNYC